MTRTSALAARRARLPWFVLTALLAAACGVWRAWHLENVVGAYTACRGCFLLPTLGQDAWLVALICAVLGLAAATSRRVLRWALVVAALLLLFAMAFDLFLLRLLLQRLYLADLLRFGANLAHDWSVARDLLFSREGWPWWVATLLFASAVVGLARSDVSRRQLLVLVVCAAFALVFAAGVGALLPLRYVHTVYTDNLIVANLPQGREQPFSAAYAQRQQTRAAALPVSCSAGAVSGKSVVIVLTESLSAYQSALLGGPRHWLPQLDALARRSHYFTHFYANGFATDGGEIAVLTGRLPIVPAGATWYTGADFGPADDSLVGIAHRAGYGAHYFTNADLSFIGSGAWLQSLGFDSIEGNEHPFYNTWPRGEFGAAEDAALFGRFEQWLDQRADSKPFVAVLLTVSSHPPFVDPRSGRSDAEGVFRYVDAQLADFHAQLARRGFLDHGVLLITGDHRSMTPLSDEEYRRFGERAFARVPLIVAGAVDMPAVVDAAFQQSDIAPSVAQFIGAPTCRSAFAGAFLETSPAPPRYVLHTRGDDRNRVDVYFDERVAGYAEDGDRSHWLGPTRPPDAQTVAAWIDAQRLRRATPVP